MRCLECCGLKQPRMPKPCLPKAHFRLDEFVATRLVSRRSASLRWVKFDDVSHPCSSAIVEYGRQRPCDVEHTPCHRDNDRPLELPVGGPIHTARLYSIGHRLGISGIDPGDLGRSRLTIPLIFEVRMGFEPTYNGFAIRTGCADSTENIGCFSFSQEYVRKKRGLSPSPHWTVPFTTAGAYVARWCPPSRFPGHTSAKPPGHDLRSSARQSKDELYDRHRCPSWPRAMSVTLTAEPPVERLESARGTVQSGRDLLWAVSSRTRRRPNLALAAIGCDARGHGALEGAGQRRVG